MPGDDFRSIDDYELYLAETIGAWKPEQRLALAVALAERWLPAYETFSKAEDWGDPASLRRTLDALWGHLLGRRLRPADLARYRQQLDDSTPHLDDFEALEALLACTLLGDALRCCETADNTPFALRAALSCFEVDEPDWPLAPPGKKRRAWQQVAIRKELDDQLELIEHVAAIARFGDQTVQTLRASLKAPRFRRKLARMPPVERRPPTITNQTAFEQYRRMAEADLKSQHRAPLDPDRGPYLFALTLFAEWMARYTRRMNTLNGGYGRLADEAGQQALVAWNRARDAAVPGDPAWDPEARSVIDLSLANNQALGTLDAGPGQPHGYGPSLRRLWLEAKARGQPDGEAWKSIRTWASHRPAAWAAEDQRKRKGLALTTPKLAQALAREVRWAESGDPAEPWLAEVDGQVWRVRLNDFPDDLMYSLVRAGAVVGSFHDWPETWQRL